MTPIRSRLHYVGNSIAGTRVSLSANRLVPTAHLWRKGLSGGWAAGIEVSPRGSVCMTELSGFDSLTGIRHSVGCGGVLMHPPGVLLNTSRGYTRPVGQFRLGLRFITV